MFFTRLVGEEELREFVHNMHEFEATIRCVRWMTKILISWKLWIVMILLSSIQIRATPYLLDVSFPFLNFIWNIMTYSLLTFSIQQDSCAALLPWLAITTIELYYYYLQVFTSMDYIQTWSVLWQYVASAFVIFLVRCLIMANVIMLGFKKWELNKVENELQNHQRNY